MGALAFTMGVIVWGAYVRATGSGAGCGDHWPVCRGEIIPRAPSVQTMIEFSHRISSGLSFLAVAVMAWMSRRAFPAGAEVRRWAGLALGFMVLEATAGAALVKLELVANNASANRAVAMSAHLLITLGLLAAMTLTCWSAWKQDQGSSGGPGATQWLAIGLFAVVGVTGAIAALGDTLVQQSVSSPLVDLLVRLRLIHPLVAIAATISLLVAVGSAWHLEGARRWAVSLVVLLGLQIIAGLINVSLGAPVWMQLLHLFIADGLWVVLIVLARHTAGVRAKARANAGAAQSPSPG
jgi:heme A synthase